MGRYAENTTVPVERSRAEMIATLGRFGVKKFGWDMQDDADVLFFEINGRGYRMLIVRPLAKDLNIGPRTDVKTALEKEWQRRWRANAMMLKMRLEFAESGDSTAEHELLPYLLMQGGKETLAEAVLGGHLPLLNSGAKA